MEICIDFDGTCTTHDFPEVGKDIGAAPVLKKLVEAGHNLILFTMRSDVEKVDTSNSPELHPEPGNYLTDAINWFNKNEIPLYGIQSNPTQKTWTTSPKAYGHLYIDDAALGCPLVYPMNGNRPFVDWVEVEKILINSKLIINK